MKCSEADVYRIADDPRMAFHAPRWEPVHGKMRLLTKPKRIWKMPYQWLGIFIRREFPIHPAAHGSVPGKSPFTMGRRHIGLKNVLSRDVKSAFPSVQSDRFFLQLLAHGFQNDMARLLTRLLLPDGCIPQGGPASNPAIDLFFYRIDCDIERELSVLGVTYTRFTDNLDTSFHDAADAPAVSATLEKHLSRLGLGVNQKKLEKDGWQPRGQEQVLCGVRVDLPGGTRLPSRTLSSLINGCDSLYRGALSVAPHTLAGLANHRQSVQGLLNQASQADFAPVREIQRRLKQIDFIIRASLRREGIFPSREWYTKGVTYDTPAEIAGIWQGRRIPTRVAA